MTKRESHIPDALIDEVRHTADIVTVVGSHVKLTQKGEDHWGVCPFHGDSDPSFKVNRAKGRFHCFGCGENGDVFTFVQKAEGVSFPQAVRNLAAQFGVELPRPKLSPAQKEKADKVERLRKALQAAEVFFTRYLYSQNGRIARTYLAEKRGMTSQEAQSFGLGYAPDSWDELRRHLIAHGISEELAVEAGVLAKRRQGGGAYDRFRGRIMFPIRDAGGRLVSFAGRLIAGGEPKYINGPETTAFSKSNTLYNFDQARSEIHRRKRAIVVEGYFDVTTCSCNGFPETVAPMGTALTENQVRLLKSHAPEALLVFDGDQAGVRAALKSLPLFIEQEMPVRALVLPDGEDPDLYIKANGGDAFELALQEARPLLEFYIDDLVAQGDLDSVEGKSGVVGQFGEIISKIEDSVTVWLYTQYLADKLGVPAAVIISRLGLDLPGEQASNLLNQQRMGSSRPWRSWRPRMRGIPHFQQ
jgi:DNA primase